MTVAVSLRGALEPIVVDEDFAGSIQALNLAKAQGISFWVADKGEGKYVAISVGSILSIEEIEGVSELPNFVA